MRVLLLSALLLMSIPVGAQTVEELQAQLEAQKRINDLLKQRIDTLENEVAGRVLQPPPRTPSFRAPAAGDYLEGERALERTLVQRGTAVLSPGVVEVTPGLSWIHSGSSFSTSTDNIYGASIDLRVGLTGGWMGGVGVPLYHRDIQGRGKNSGPGDVVFTAWKSFRAQDRMWPSVVGSLEYGAPTGEDSAETSVPLGSGFHRLTGQLYAVKTVDPIAFYGNVSYTHFLEESIEGVNLNRLGAVGFGLGVSLVATPEITLSAGIALQFDHGFEVNDVKARGSDTTTGSVELGVGILLTRKMFLTLSGAFGITDDSPDVALGVSLPIRY